MKKIFLLIIFVLTLFSFNYSFWESWKINVKVTEKIPWASCTWSWNNITCSIKPWFWSVSEMIWKIIKWFTAIAALWGVLFIVINWILLSMWAFDKDKAKQWIIKTISWLIILLLSWLILNIIAPWVYR